MRGIGGSSCVVQFAGGTLPTLSPAILADLEATRRERDDARKELEEARAMLKMTVDALVGTAYFIKETDNWESFNEWSNCND